MRILLVEDDLMIGRSLVQALKKHGMAVDWARTGHDGDEAIRAGGHSIVLLDLGLPGMSGLEVLKAARRSGNRIPVVVITARDGLDEAALARQPDAGRLLRLDSPGIAGPPCVPYRGKLAAT